jgi:hypothetical protein
MGRTKETLKRKFVSLYQKRTPTGDPKCPSEVRRAKQLYEEIKKKADLSDGSDSEKSDGAGGTADDDDDNDDIYDDAEQGEGGDNDDVEQPAPPAEQPAPPKKKQKTFVQSSEKPLNRIRGIRSHKKKTSSLDDNDFTFKDMMKFAMMQSAQEAKISRENARMQQQSNLEFMKMMMMISAGGTAATKAAVSSPLEDVVTSLEPATSGGDTKEYAEDKLDGGDEDSDDNKEDAPHKKKALY